MKSVLFVLSLICVTLHVKAQYYDNVLNYNINGTPLNGIKVKTNLPFTNSSQMPTIFIEGYSYSTGEPINLTFNYYIYNNSFINSKVSSAGSATPAITLAAENGKVVFFIDSKVSFQRIHIRAFATGLAEAATYFDNWTAVDSTLLGTATANYIIPYQNRMAGTVTVNGNLGVGNLAPSQKLTVNGNILLGLGNAIGMALTDSTSYDGKYLPNYGIQWVSDSQLPGAPTLWAGSFGGIKLFTNRVPRLSINVDGNVGIGTITPGAYKLAVEGTIGGRRIKVTQQSTWADFVFQPDYQLPSLQEVENYINTNKHLPGIPTTEEVQKEGVDVGEMNKLLLQKVEELTLYMIKIQKEVDQLKISRK
jgi:hypothetical protein